VAAWQGSVAIALGWGSLLQTETAAENQSLGLTAVLPIAGERVLRPAFCRTEPHDISVSTSRGWLPVNNIVYIVGLVVVVVAVLGFFGLR
jgi:hypothetical protein